MGIPLGLLSTAKPKSTLSRGISVGLAALMSMSFILMANFLNEITRNRQE